MAKNIRIGQAAVAGGTVDALTITLSPALTPYNTMPVFFRSSGPNLTTTPTADVNGDGAKTITKKGGEALVAGDIDGDHLMMYDLPNTRWELLNPASEIEQFWEISGNTVSLIDKETRTLRIDNMNIGGGGTAGFLYANILGNVALNPDIPDGTTATTQAAGDNSTKVATTEYVDRVNVQSVASAATVTATAADDLVIITAQAAGLTLANPTGTWQQGQALVIRIKDNGTSRSIAYGAKFRALGTTLPTATTISKTIYLFVIYNSTDDTFDVTGVSEQA